MAGNAEEEKKKNEKKKKIFSVQQNEDRTVAGTVMCLAEVVPNCLAACYSMTTRAVKCRAYSTTPYPQRGFGGAGR